MNYKLEKFISDLQIELCRKYGMLHMIAEKYTDPLVWFLSTGRASAQFEKKLLASRKYMIARKLYQNYGTYEKPIEEIKKYLG